MNLKELFDMQHVLDERIVKEKGLEGQNLLDEKVLALQVELGECANCWRGFKFWSENRNPTTKALRHPAMMEEDKEYYNPLLEEYVDCLHFLLSIGLELNEPDEMDMFVQIIEMGHTRKMLNVVEQFNYLFWCITPFVTRYEQLFNGFIGLGEMLGFTWEQIEQAYKEKHAINIMRQNNGY